VATALVGIAVSVVFQSAAGDANAIPFTVGESDPDLRAASVDAFHAALLVSAGFMIAGALTAFFGMRTASGAVTQRGRQAAAVTGERPRGRGHRAPGREALPSPEGSEHLPPAPAVETLAYTWCDVDRCDRHESCRRAREERAAASLNP
jgi:hypothetical protein